MTGTCLLVWVPLFMLRRDKVEPKNTSTKKRRGSKLPYGRWPRDQEQKKIKGRCNCLNLFERLSCRRDIRFIPWPQRAKTEPTGWGLWVRNISIKKEFSDRARLSTNGNASGVKKEDTADLKKEKEGREERRKQRLLYRSNNILWFLWKVGSSFLPWFNFAADCFIVLGKNNTLKNLWLCKCRARTLF